MTDDSPIRRRWTVLELEKRPSGEWRATESGAAEWASGETAAEAALAYCRRVAATVGECENASDPADSTGAGGQSESAAGESHRATSSQPAHPDRDDRSERPWA